MHEKQSLMIDDPMSCTFHAVYRTEMLMVAERKSDKCRLYNFSRIKKTRKWLKV